MSVDKYLSLASDDREISYGYLYTHADMIEFRFRSFVQQYDRVVVTGFDFTKMFEVLMSFKLTKGFMEELEVINITDLIDNSSKYRDYNVVILRDHRTLGEFVDDNPATLYDSVVHNVFLKKFLKTNILELIY
jgi:hypothetical protein